jgi:hypothetical protein
MSADKPYTTCPYCRRPVDPDARGVVYAVSFAGQPGFGQDHDAIEDHKAFFHAECPPEKIGYVIPSGPTPRDAARAAGYNFVPVSYDLSTPDRAGTA